MTEQEKVTVRRIQDLTQSAEDQAEAMFEVHYGEPPDTSEWSALRDAFCALGNANIYLGRVIK